jgi:hypothetical protein
MRRGIAVVLALAGTALALPTGAAGNHHLMVISEVYAGPTAAQSGFVELQMYAAGQEVVIGQHVSFYESEGSNTPIAAFTSNVASGQNQRTILIGDTGVPGADLEYAGLDAALDDGGGAACFESTVFGTIDCVAWGAFDNSIAALPVGTNAPALPDGQSLTRSIARGCATLLEAGDDTGDSAADFALAAPSPRPNSVAPTETTCAGGGGGGGGGGDTDPPQTKIKKAPKGKIDAETVRVKFKSDEPNSSFECKLDRKPYKPCKSPKKLKHLDDGKHKFKVRATDAAGNTDGSPAKAKFKIVD